MNVIHTKQLCKIYTRYEKEEGLRGSLKSLFHREMIEKAAVCDFDLSVEAGEFIGLIGPNGAGKTTLVKLLTGIIRKTSGEMRVLGYDPNRLQNEFKRQYSVVMGQKSQLFPELSAADTFRLYKEMYGIPDAAYRRNRDYLLELFGVRGLLDVQTRTLSLGERMKMELVCALIHDPRVLFLDEPTIGLDAIAQKQIRGFLHDLNRDRGTTILLTSHYMEDIRALCKRCVVVGGGRKLYDGGLEALFDSAQTHRKATVTFRTATDYTPCGEGVRVLEQTPWRVCFLVPRHHSTDVLQALLGACDVDDIAIEEEDLGDVVARIYAPEARV